MQAVASMSSSASWISFIFHWSLGSFFIYLSLLLHLGMLLGVKVSEGSFSFIFHFTWNATTRKSQNAKAKHLCYVDHGGKDNIDILILIDSIIILSALVTSESEKHQEPTQHPLLHSIHSGEISQEQNPANTTDSIEQHEFTTAGENYFGKETSTGNITGHILVNFQGFLKIKF